ncbi:nucleotidyl transferase AbiEii/AbiGii toxin family protein [Synergistaceae bacterium OttesenSCG-928-I11]|nr:nucleotidyl transferase AbiEii/AbiGii toxin family protein [Synergistaceae bacterium OttesenSCG-928-I11]
MFTQFATIFRPDSITPGAVSYALRSVFSENTTIQLWAYNVETILAEKIETVLRRGIFNSRMRDFYDIHVLTKTQSYDVKILRESLRRAAEHSESVQQVINASAILDSIGNSKELAKYWSNYRREYEYARDISFSEIITALQELAEHVMSSRTNYPEKKLKFRVNRAKSRTGSPLKADRLKPVDLDRELGN